MYTKKTSIWFPRCVYVYLWLTNNGQKNLPIMSGETNFAAVVLTFLNCCKIGRQRKCVLRPDQTIFTGCDLITFFTDCKAQKFHEKWRSILLCNVLVFSGWAFFGHMFFAVRSFCASKEIFFLRKKPHLFIVTISVCGEAFELFRTTANATITEHLAEKSQRVLLWWHVHPFSQQYIQALAIRIINLVNFSPLFNGIYLSISERKTWFSVYFMAVVAKQTANCLPDLRCTALL